MSRSALRTSFVRGLEGLPGGVLFALALTAVAVVGAADELDGARLHLAPLYVLPVAFAAWLLGRLGGLAIALASAIAWWAEERVTRLYAAPVRAQVLDTLLELGLLVTVALLVARCRALTERSAALMRADALTGLLTRRGFAEVARHEVARMARTGRPLALALADVDRFDAINAANGQEAGDQVLLALSAALRQSTRAVDACARLDGDEFAVLLPDADTTVVGAVVERLRLVMAQAAAERGLPVTLSMGAALFERPPAGVDEMLKSARRLLATAKAAGGDSVRQEVIA